MAVGWDSVRLPGCVQLLRVWPCTHRVGTLSADPSVACAELAFLVAAAICNRSCARDMNRHRPQRIAQSDARVLMACPWAQAFARLCCQYTHSPSTGTHRRCGQHARPMGNTRQLQL